MLKLLRIAVAGSLLLAGMVLMVALGSRTPTGQAWIRSAVERALGKALGATVRVGRVSGSLVRDLALHDVRVVASGRTVARVARLELVHDVQTIIRGRVHVERLIAVRPRLRAVHDADGWQLPAIPPGDGGPPIVDVDRIEVVDGRAALALLDTDPPRRLAATGIDGEASLHVGLTAIVLRLGALRFTPRGAALTPGMVTGTLTVDGDLIQAEGLRIATARSRVGVDGSVVLGTRVDARLTLEPLVARELGALLGEDTLRSDVRGLAAVQGPWNAVGVTLGARLEPGGMASATGHVDLGAAPIQHAFHVRFAELDPGAAVSGLPRARLTGHLRAEGVGLDPDGTWRARLALGPSDVEGRALTALGLTAAGRGGHHRARARAVVAAGTASARADVRSVTPLVYRGHAEARVTQLDALLPGVTGAGTVALTIAGRGVDPTTREATLDAVVSDATVREVAVTRATLAARLVGERVELARAEIQGPGLRGEARGTFQIDGTAADLTGQVTGELAPLTPIAATALAGRVSLRGTARGAREKLAVVVTGEGERLVVGSATAGHATLRLELSAPGTEAARGRAQVSLARPTLGDQTAQALSADATWAVAGRETRGELRSVILDTETASWHLAKPARFTLADGVSSPGLTLVSGTQRIEASGRIAWTSASDARIAITGVALAPLCALADARSCSGNLELRGMVRGTAAAPELTATLTATGLRIDDVAYGTLTADARYKPRTIHLEATLRHPDAGDVRLRGDLPIDLAWAGARQDLRSAPIDMTLTADRLDLRFVRGLAPAQLRASEGRLTLNLRLTGPRSAPQAFGDVTLRNGRLELTATGVSYHNLRLTAVAVGDRLDVQELRGRTGDGTLEGAGVIGLSGAGSGVGVKMALKQFLVVRRPAYEAIVSGTLDLTGTLAHPELAGQLTVEHGILRPANLPLSAPSLEPDDTIEIVNAPVMAAVPPPPPPPAILEQLRLAIAVELGDDVSVRRTDAHIRLGGAVQVSRAPASPVVLDGRIRLIRGWYAFQGRRFEIRQGVVRFAGESPPQPTFDVTAEYRATDYTIQVHVEGSMEKPHLTLSSEPPLEQADVLSVLLFGKPSRSLGRSDGLQLQQNAVALASGYVMPELQTSVMETLGLSSLEVALPDGTTPGRVGVGRYVGSDLFISLAQEFGARSAEVVSVEYGLTPRISVRGSTSTRGTGAIDLFWSRRY